MVSERGVAVILNPAADRGRASRREPLIRRGLEDRGIDFELFLTEGPGDATELARIALREGFSAVVGAGGDGTLNEIAQALVGTDVPMGAIPCGSGNDFIRALGIPNDVQRALDHLAGGGVRTVDVGQAAGRFFINCLGIGIDGQIAADYKRMRFLKGEFGYLWAALVEVFRFRGFLAEVEVEGRVHRGKLALLPVQNGPFAGGGFRIAPGARPDDGTLDMVLIRDRSVPKRLPLLMRIRRGTYLGMPGIKPLRIRRASIRVERPLPVHLDGELLPEPLDRLEVEVVPEGLRVIA